MKRIKCDSCAGKWMIENADLEKLTVCPYCGASIQGEVEFSEYDTLDKAIYGAILYTKGIGTTRIINVEISDYANATDTKDGPKIIEPSESKTVPITICVQTITLTIF